MMKNLLIALSPLVLLSQTQPDAAPDDREAIKQTALDYAQSWYEGDAERMARALHPDLAKRVLMPGRHPGKGKIEHMSAMRLYQAVKEGHGTKVPADQRRTDVTILDVFGNAASVKLEMHDWIDYMHMSKTGGRWVIVNVLWELTPEAKKRHGIPAEL